MWSVHRQTPPYLSVRHSDVVNDLGSAYYWNAPGLYLGNKVRCRRTLIYTLTHSVHMRSNRIIMQFFSNQT